MSRRNQDLVSRVKFEVDSRMANATMQALQTHAEKLNQQVAEVNASIKALGNVPDDNPALLEYRKQLRRLNSDLKDVNTTMKDYTRGVKAAGELYRHYAMGNIEDMSIKAIRAGVNGMKKRLDNLKAGGDPGDAEEMRLIEAITTEADVVVKRFKTDYQHVVEEIARGGTVTEQTLKRTRDGLADLMQTAETEAEKNELTNYWQKVGAAIEAVAVENRRLRGEVADREEAMRIAYDTDHEGSQQAIHDAEARADAARRENDELRQRLDLKQQQRRELGQEMDINSMQQRALMDRRDELKAQEKEDRAIRNQRVDDANKELNAARRAAKTQQQAYDEQKQTVEKLRTEVQGLTDDIRKMGEAKAEPKIDTSGIDAKLEELRGSLSRVQQMKSTAQEKIASAKEVLGDTDKPWNNERVKKALEEDRVTQEENVAKLNAKWDEYWEKQEQNAREFAAVLNKAAIDDVDWDEFYTHVTGPNAEMAKSWYRVQQRNMRGVDYWGEDSDNYKELVSLRASKKLGSASDGMLEELKLLEALKRKWDEYQKALNKAREESPKYDAAYNELDKARTEIIQQERLLETYTEHERQLKEQIAETEKLSQAQQQSTTATAAQTEALKQQEQELESLKKDLTDATNDLNRSQGNLAESLKPLDELGLKEADLEDKAKLRAAAEKKVLEIMEAQANVEKEVAEQSRKIISGLKPNALGGTKADQEFYAKNKNAYAIDDNIDDVMDRIAHLETVSKLKNGRKFSDDTGWDPDDELDESEAIVMTDKEKQNALDELRVLKQHVREVILKAIREVGDVDKAVLEVTGGDGVAEDTKFGEQINDKISDLKDKIQEQITTTLESYEDILDEVDRDEKLSKQEVEHRVNSHIEYLKDNVARDRDDVDYFQGKVSDANTAIAAKEKEIELTKQQTTATAAQAQSSEQLAQKQEQLSQKTAELNQQQDKLNGMVGETVTANQRLAKAEQEQTDARNAQAEAKKHEGEAVKKVEDELRGLTDEQLKNAQAYSHLTEEINADTAAMQRNITAEQEATREADRLRSGSIDKMEQALARLRESNRKLDPTIDKEEWERGERAIGQLNLRLEELKKQSAELRREKLAEEAERIAKIVGGDMVNAVQSVSSRIEQATQGTRDAMSILDGQIDDVNREMSSLSQHMDEVGNRSTNLMPYVNSITESTKALQEQKAERQEYLNTFQEEAKERAKNIEEQKRQIALMEQERDAQLQTLDQRIKSQQENLEVLKTLHPQTETFSQISASLEQEIQRLQEEKVALENSEEIKQKLAEANKRLADMIEADAKEIATSETVIAAFDQKIDEIQQSMAKLTHSVPGFDAEELMKYESELSSLTAELQKHQKEREQFIATFEKERAERAQAIEQQKQQIAAIEKEREASINSVNARLEAAQQALAQLRELPDELRGSLPVSDMIQTQLRTIRELQKERFSVATDAEQRLKQANDNLAASIKSDEEATAKAQATIQQYDAQIQKLETDIAQLTQKLSSAKSPLDAKDMEESAKKMGELQAQLKTLTDEREKYVALLQRQTEEAQDLAEAEYAKAVAEKDGMSIEKMEDAVKVLEERRRTLATDSPEWEKNEQYIQTLNNRLTEVKQKVAELSGEWMSLEKAMELASKAGTDQFAGSAKGIQLATQSLERQRDTIIATIREKRNLGQATKAEEDQLADLTKKLRSLKFEQDNVNMSQEKMRTLIETPANAVNLDELRAAIKRADGQLRQMQQSLGENSSEYKRFAEQVRNAKNVMKEMEGQAKASATAWEKAFSRLKTYVVMYMGFNEVWQKVSNTARDLMDLSDRMGEVRKTTGFTADEVGRLSENLKKMDVRTSLTSLMEISASAGQLGLKTLEDVQGFTEAANKLMIALPEMGREAATEMMRVAIATGEVDKIRKQLQEGTVEGSSATAVAMEKIASTIDRLRATSASTAPEITDFVKRVGAVGAQSGITIDQVAALGSTVSSLGMRIEMSATALSRMIPAIRNNAFELAKAIGVTPDTIRNLFDTGRGMEVILMILQRIKDTGMDADSVEQMLGMAGMRDIMKDLNQQGARAGIVFSGLSQNVDELRRQLGVANQAYEENIAIQQEFDKMNETTAAKWERLKNAFEEMFVGDEAQRGLGVLIDGLRKAVDLINDLHGYILRIGIAFAIWKTGVGGAIWTYLINPIRLALTGVRSLNFQVKGLAATWRTAWKSMDAATKTNWIVALGSAIFMLGKYIYDTANRVSELDQALNELQHEESNNEHILNRLVTAFNNVSTKAAEATKKHDELEKKTKELNDEVDQLKKSTDLSTEATETLKKKEEELKKTKEELNKATDEMNKANNTRLDLIKQINDKYSTYLGYMLSEKTAAEEVATAHQLIISALKEEMAQKRMLRSQEAIENEFGEDITEWRQNSWEELNSGVLEGHKDLQQQVMEQWESVMARISYDTEKGVFTIPAIDGINGQAITKKTVEELRPIMQQLLSNTMTKVAKDAGVDRSFYFGQAGTATDKAQTSWGGTYGSWSTDDGFARWTEATLLREQRIQQQHAIDNAGLEGAHTQTVEDAKANINQNRDNLLDLVESNQTFTEEQIRKMAQNVNAVVAGFNKYGKDLEESSFELVFGKDKEATLENAVTTMLAGVGEDVRKRVLKTAKAAATSPNGTGSVDTTTTNPWGTPERADSTTYTEMTAEQLVNRRKQMNDFVNSIQTDTDVKAVLEEDKALKKAIEAGMSSDMRTVIEWYNAERLKIQDELHARHLTNTGDWLDPKKERGAKKQFRDEMDAYLHELDAYYTERKTRIEEAGTDEGLTEAEIRNRTLDNEMEWQQRRAELQKLYSRKQQEVTQEELEAIYHIISERTGDTESFVKAQIAKTNQFVDAIEKSGDKGAAIVHRWMSQVELDTERSYLKGQQALTKQMKAIEDIIDKERPFNGITKQLRESLSTMDILTGDMRKEYDELMKAGKDMRDFNERQGREELRRTSFLLGQAEQAYSTTIDRVMQQMREKGMTAWADWLSIHPEQQEALMAQLRQTYDGIQDAIKKEASQLKKQAEIMWNNILVPGGDGKTTMKQMLDRTVAQLGIDQGRVSRANSLIGAGASSERVADKLAIQQMRLQLTMQEHYYNLMKKQGRAHVDMLNQQAEAAKKRGDAEEATRKTLDAQHAEMALNLATAKEETELAKQREEIIARTEESQNRLYTELREWADLLTSSLQGVFEASHAGDAEYYNERAKLDLTGSGGPGAGTYVVIDDAGTSDAAAHYEYLDEREALERQHEIEVQNAQAEAWRKLMDDLNMKMSEQITDWLNAALQNQSIDANTDATLANTEALIGLSGAIAGSSNGIAAYGTGGTGLTGSTGGAVVQNDALSPADVQEWTDALGTDPWLVWEQAGVSAMQGVQKATADTGKKMAASTQSTFAKMTQAANLYGIAYQTMSNDNLSASQKFQMFALQAAGNAAIAMLTTDLAAGQAKNTVQLPGILGKLLGEMPYPAAIATFAAVTALLGGLMGLAMSKVAKSKGEIAQATGASVGAGRLATGMLTYAEGNVNELTDPASLTPGRQYNVDGADGKTYRARYMGKGAKTHITNGPEFHLVGEAGREAIIDAKTTRLLQMNETGIWRDIQTLYNGGSISGLSTRRRRGGVAAFADGNIGEFEDMADGGGLTAEGTGGMSIEMLASLQASIDRQSDLLENALVNGIKAVNKWTGSDGIPAMYNKMQKEAQRHGEKYL